MTALLNKIRTHLLSPDSPFELFLRTIYHKVLSTRFYFYWQDYLAQRSYRKFRRLKLQNLIPNLTDNAYQPKVTFLLSGQNASLQDIQRTLQSIQALQGHNWEVLLISLSHQFENNNINIEDPRIILANDSSANLLKSITGEFVVFCTAGDCFYSPLLAEFYQSLPADSPAQVTYYDCEFQDQKSGKLLPFFKPVGCSPALMLSVNYLSRGFIHAPILTQFWRETEHNTTLEGFEYSLMLYLCENGLSLNHISKILLSQVALVTPHMQDNRTAVAQHLTHKGLTSVSSTENETGLRFTWSTHSPSLAIIVLSKNNQQFLQSLIPALLQQPYKGEKSIYIVDNGSDDPATLAYYQQLHELARVKIIPYPQPFNYSEAINLGVHASKSELVLLLNDDMAVIDDSWLTELAQWATRPEIGVVGAKLVRKNHTIQHMGIIMGLTGFAGHIYLNAPENYHGLFGSANWYRNILAITGACQIVRRDVFNEVGGYDEGYQLAFGDIDFCLRVHEKGYHNVYSPFARLYHYEGSTRGYQTPVDDALKGYESLGSYLINEDPYFSPNLTYSRIPKCVFKKRSRDDRERQIQARRNFYLQKEKPL